MQYEVMINLKKIVCASLLLTLSPIASLRAQGQGEHVEQTAGGIKFFSGTFDQALAEAKKQGKPLFVDFYAVWCVPCKKMAKTVFTQDSVGSYFNDKFLNLQLDAEKPENVDIAKKYKVEAFPTLGFIDTEGKPLAISVGALQAKELLEIARQAVGDVLSFEKLYEMYHKDPQDLSIQQQLLRRVPSFLSAQEGMSAEKWVVRIQKLYRSYIAAKMAQGDALINPQDYVIINTLGGDDQEEVDKMIEYINSNLPKWRSAIGDPASYYVVEKNDERMERLAKAGDKRYLDYLEKLRTDYKDAYSVIPNLKVPIYDRSKGYYEAVYSIYKDKDVDKYLDLMQKYLISLGDEATGNDYGRAAQAFYYAAGSKLKDKHHKKAIEWLEKAVASERSLMDKINYLVMVGDSYKALKQYDSAKKYYNQAYAESLQMVEMERAQKMIQLTVMRKLSELELLRK